MSSGSSASWPHIERSNLQDFKLCPEFWGNGKTRPFIPTGSPPFPDFQVLTQQKLPIYSISSVARSLDGMNWCPPR